MMCRKFSSNLAFWRCADFVNLC